MCCRTFGLLYEARGELDNAKPLMHRSLQIRVKALGPESALFLGRAVALGIPRGGRSK